MNNDNDNEVSTEVNSVPPKMINGTTCTNCFKVFAYHQGKQIGIRPLFFGQGDKSFIGFRIRATHNKDNPTGSTDMAELGENVVDIETAGSIVKSFHMFEFGKIENHRCSLVGGMFVAIPDYDKKPLKDFFQSNRIVSKIITSLAEKLGGIELVNEEDLHEFLTTEYRKLMEIEQFVTVDSDAQVLQFPSTAIHMDSGKAQAELQSKMLEHETENQD